ncbi:MAG: TetR/AcrR family transcriptional regulator [Actinobacteria bacterium]|nr:TetR/AcrR family transcriptional regulator [Actinomycetota bacterium]
MPRPYRLGKREELVAETRLRIIQAARSLIAEGGLGTLTLNRVAENADVARATVYYQFQSKSGLLEGVAVDAERRASIGRFEQIGRTRVAEDAVRYLLREMCRFWSAEEPIFRAYTALAKINPEVRQVAESHDADRRRNLKVFVGRLAVQGDLACSRKEAVDVLWVLTGFEIFDQLVGKGGLSLDAAARRLWLMAGPIVVS